MLTRQKIRKFALCLFIGLLSAGTALAQATPRASERRKIQIIPSLEVQTLGKEFIKWGNEMVIYQPGVLSFHWGKPVSSTSFVWEVYKHSIQPANRLGSGRLASSPDPAKFHFFTIDLNGILPSTPANKPTEYYVRVVPQGADLVTTPAVRIIYKKDASKTNFTFRGLYPEFFQPMPIYVNLHTFRIIKADEEDAEEPYLIPIIAYLDGTTFNVASLPTSSVRVETSPRQNAHGNIPRSNTLGSGVDVSIPKDVGYFEKEILPVNIEMVESILGVRLKDVTKSTVVWIMVIAMEEDANDDSVANAVRDAVVAGLQEQFNQCVQGMTLAEVLKMMQQGLDLSEIVTTHEEVTFCGYTATADKTILDQITESLVGMGKSAGKEDVFLNAWTFLHGGIINSFDDVVDPDDYIGFKWSAFTYDQLMREPGAIPFKLNFKRDNASINEAGTHFVEYEVLGAIGRCQKQPGKSECLPVKKPLLPKFP